MSTSEKVLAALRSYDLKREKDGHYRCNSPLRPGSNSHGFTLKIDDDEHGAYTDHVSGDSGSLYDLAKHLGIEVRQAVEDSKRDYKGIADYAAAHGVTVETLHQAGWKETTYQGRLAIEFPTKTGKRWRFLDGNTPHYKSQKDYERCWYGLNEKAMAKIMGQGLPLVICNGEISVVAAHHYGLPAAAITGGEKAEIPPNLLKELREFLAQAGNPSVLAAMDCDPTGRKSANGIVKQLMDSGYLNVRAVDLGLGRGGDLADFCKLQDDKAASAIQNLPDLDMESIRYDTGYAWRIIPASDLSTLPKVSWLIDRELQAFGLNVVYGPSGVGKSFWALDKALHLAQTLPIVYMAGEGVYGYEKRVKAWCEHHHKPNGALFMVTAAVNLMDKEEHSAFIDSLRPISPRLVVVDTLARSMVGFDDSHNRDMGILVRACDEIKHALGCAVLLVHHTNKQGNQERGATALRGAADVMVKITDAGDSIRVEMDKVKDESPLPPRFYQLVSVGDSVVFIESDNVIQTEDDPLSRNQLKALYCIHDMEGATSDDIATELGIGKRAVQTILKRLKSLGFVEQDGKNQPYTLTEAGAKRISESHKKNRLA